MIALCMDHVYGRYIFMGFSVLQLVQGICMYIELQANLITG